MAYAATVTTMPQMSCNLALMDDNAVAGDVAAVIIIVATRIIFICSLSFMFLPLLLLLFYIAYGNSLVAEEFTMPRIILL